LNHFVNAIDYVKVFVSVALIDSKAFFATAFYILLCCENRNVALLKLAFPDVHFVSASGNAVFKVFGCVANFAAIDIKLAIDDGVLEFLRSIAYNSYVHICIV
jgi:hypothetical protein